MMSPGVSTTAATTGCSPSGGEAGKHALWIVAPQLQRVPTSQFTALLGSLTSLPSVQTSLQRSLSRRQLTLHLLTQPQDPIADRARADGTSVSYWTVSNDAGFAAGRASGRDVALVFITADSGEAQYTVEGNQGDRNDLFAWHNGVRHSMGRALRIC